MFRSLSMPPQLGNMIPIIADRGMWLSHFMRQTLKRFVMPLLLVLTACGSSNAVNDTPHEPDIYGREPDPALVPVTDLNAKKVRELLNAGLLIVGQREAACYSGLFTTCDGFDALYLGKDQGQHSLADYACPGTKEPSDEWKCRRLNPPYEPNGGFKPNIKAHK